MTFQSFILNLSIEKERIISGRPPSAKLGLISSSAFFSHYDCRESAACASCAIGEILPQRLMFAHKEPLLGIYLMPRTDHWQIMLMLIVIGYWSHNKWSTSTLLTSRLLVTQNEEHGFPNQFKAILYRIETIFFLARVCHKRL